MSYMLKLPKGNRKSSISPGGKLENTFRPIKVLLGSQEQDSCMYGMGISEYS